MTIKEIYQNKELPELIKIIEKPSDYTQECVMVVIEEIKTRDINSEEAKQLAEENIRNNFAKNLNSFDPFHDKIIPPKSHFLNEEEVLLLLKTEFDTWLSKRESYDFDVWLYAVGGGI